MGRKVTLRWAVRHLYIFFIAAVGFGATAFLGGAHIAFWLVIPLVWFGAAVAIQLRRHRNVDPIDRAHRLVALGHEAAAIAELRASLAANPRRDDVRRMLEHLERGVSTLQPGASSAAEVRAAYERRDG